MNGAAGGQRSVELLPPEVAKGTIIWGHKKQNQRGIRLNF